MTPTRSSSEPEAAARNDSKEIVVFMVRRDTRCADCSKELFGGSMLRMEGDGPLCLDCADLGHLKYLPSGNTAVTRRATKHSPLRALVVRWSRTRKRYERQGILVTPDPIEPRRSVSPMKNSARDNANALRPDARSRTTSMSRPLRND
jgi:hypothetical protein